jgi:hypothetical protein
VLSRLLLLVVAGMAMLHAHPRLIFRAPEATGPGRTFAEVRALYREDAAFRAIFAEALKDCESSKNPAALATCWIVSEQERFALEAIRILREQEITESGSGRYSNVWSFALAWDWLHGHAAMGNGVREQVAARIAERLAAELDQLDDRGMALWHGRNQAANGAMIAALALAEIPGQQVQLSRATAHYAEALNALDYTEGWPEGPSYWIYNRAMPYALAADSYLTATGAATVATLDVRSVMRKVGLWTVYQYGPNGVFEPYGDSQGSLRLGETGLWEASVDYFAKLSRDEGVMAGADFFRVRSRRPYGHPSIHWYVALGYEPKVRPKEDYDPARPELWLRRKMPQAALFGRRSLGVAFLRGDWGETDELFASFKAGDMLAHHDHYQAGHFSIQLRGLLAPLTGVYGGSSYYGAYRLGYAIQTVASNSLLVMASGETSVALQNQPERPWVALSGGQRVISPTGFGISSLTQYERSRQTGRLERADITAFESVPGKGDYLAADLTAAYNSTRFAEPGSEAKVSLVTRQFLYLRPQKAFVIFDRVETTDPEYRPKFLLHAITKPESATEKLLSGHSETDGILETTDRTLRIRGEGAVLTQQILLPKEVKTRKIGGPGFSGYVEPSGDNAPGTNLDTDPGKENTSPKPKGLWRVEVESPNVWQSHRFLNVLMPRLPEEPEPTIPVTLLPAGNNVVAVRVGDTVVVMSEEGDRLRSVQFEAPEDLDCWILDAEPGREYTLDGESVKASAEGVLLVRWKQGKRVLSVVSLGR